MKILICGVGAIGSNLVAELVPDLKGEHEITILDKDKVEERNVQAGTQFYTPDQVGLWKVEALQFNIYKHYQREVLMINKELVKEHPNSWMILPREAQFHSPDLVIDCFDNYKARKAISDYVEGESGGPELLHIGFSNNFTFSIEWEINGFSSSYKVPSDFISGIDICEMQGSAAFVASVASLGALVAEEFIFNNKRLEITGGKFTHSLIK